MHLKSIASSLFLFAFLNASSAQAQNSTESRPLCLSSASDVDGDGFGWEFSRTCIVDTGSTSTSAASNTSSTTVCEDPDGDGFGWDGFATCLVEATSQSGSTTQSTSAVTACVDSDGDGFGWNGVATCFVQAAPTVSPQSGSSTQSSSPVAACIDSDGDGFGWDGSATCIVDAAPPLSAQTTSPVNECIDSDGDGFGWDGFATCLVQATASVTTAPASTPVIGACIDSDGDGFGWNGVATCLVQGAPTVPAPTVAPQSGAGGITDVVLMMGQSNALGENTDVQEASLDSPDNNITVWTQFDGWQVANLCTQLWQKGWFPWRGGVCSNHPAFQIAKGIVAADPGRRVAIIPTGIAGKPISWWDPDGVAYAAAKAHVEAALAELPGISAVTLVAWSQGEADDGSEDNWFNKLNNLYSRLRSESWVNASSTVFIAQETKKSSVNNRLPSFDSDGDPLTNWIQAADLATKDGVHWSANALRTLGSRYAARYLTALGL